MKASVANTAGRATTLQSGYQRIALGLGALAIVGMGAATSACGLPHDAPTQAGSNTSAFHATSVEKALRTNVTRTPQAVAPPRGAVTGNPAVACGFGPRGGGPCANNG
jgi:hypothetical protein